MAWVYIKHDDKKETFLVATEAYESVFKKQGFKIIGNAENHGSEAQKKVENESVQPTIRKPVRQQNSKRIGV